jgi:hypothetical protein
MTEAAFDVKKLESKQKNKTWYPDKNTARIAGVLFIVATATNLLSTAFLGSVDASNYLASISANINQVYTGVLLIFVGALASAAIAISLYPVLRKYSEGLALGAVGFRLIEAMLYIVSVVSVVSLVALSQEFVKAGGSASSFFQTSGLTLLASYHWVGNGGAVVAFCLGALMYYYVFYQTRLIPRWLSGWGIMGAVRCMASGLLVMLNLVGAFSTPQVVLALPIAVQEMALAVWLIVKGFNPTVSA